MNRFAGWAWNSLGNITLLVGWIGSFVLTTWAASLAKFLVRFAPLSYIGAGLIGSLILAFGYYVVSHARARWVRTKYDNVMMQRGGLVDPMMKIFERKRIYLSEFALPSHPVIEGKTFIDCEIIGPANILFEFGNNVNDQKIPRCDAVVIAANRSFYNGFQFRNCTLRGCSLQRITLFITEDEFPKVQSVDWLNWITYAPPSDEPYLDLSTPVVAKDLSSAIDLDEAQ